jgi:hypothetical protein
VIDDVAVLDVVQVDDDELRAESAGDLALPSAMCARRRQDEATDENRGQSRPLFGAGLIWTHTHRVLELTSAFGRRSSVVAGRPSLV